MGEVSFWQYARRCFARARRGAIDLANNWAWIIGAGVGGYLAARQVRLPMIASAGPYQAVWEGLFNMMFAFVVIFGVRLFIWAPYQLYREAVADGDAARAEGNGRGAYALKRDMERRQRAAGFELWEVSCWLAEVAPHRPVVAGPAFLELEQMRRAVWDGTLALHLPPGERALFSLERNRRGAGFAGDFEIKETFTVTRAALRAYLASIGANVPGIT